MYVHVQHQKDEKARRGSPACGVCCKFLVVISVTQSADPSQHFAH